MSRLQDDVNATSTKKLRFRGELNFHRIESLDDEVVVDGTHKAGMAAAAPATPIKAQTKKEDDNSNANTTKTPMFPSFTDFFKVELTRGYMLEHDEERYTARCKKIYSFMRIPRDLERFMIYGIMQCADSFLYIHTFLPVRYIMAVWGLLTRPIANCFGLRRRSRLLSPAETCDFLKGTMWILCTVLMISVDTNRMYHIIKSQSTIKLYILYNMLEVGDRLLSAFGQDTIDALFWTATEPKASKMQPFGLLTHVFFAMVYVVLHTVLIMFQATSLNVAMNSNSKGLLTIMMSNNFVELKGSVFKKFDKNNLFQLACSDVRERFHLSVLLFIVMIQTMKEFDWSFSQFCVMLPDVTVVLFTECCIDWIKHAFITRFNELPENVYREYTTSLAYDMTQTRQKHAFSDHSDLVARRMGFIPFPLGVVLIKAVYSAVSFNNLGAWVLFVFAYVFVLGVRICLTICALGKACKLMKEHQEEKSNSTPSSMTNVPPIGVTPLPNFNSNPSNASTVNHGNTPMPAGTPQRTPRRDTAASPSQPYEHSVFLSTLNTQTTSTPRKDVELDVTNSLQLGATALFSNSDVDLDDVCLNEKVLEASSSPANGAGGAEQELARSEPDLSQQTDEGVAFSKDISCSAGDSSLSGAAKGNPSTVERSSALPKRTHKRSESEPSMQSICGDPDEPK